MGATTVPTTTSWYQVQETYTAVASGHKIQLSIYSTNTSGGGATFEIDACALTSMPAQASVEDVAAKPRSQHTSPPTTPKSLSARIPTASAAWSPSIYRARTKRVAAHPSEFIAGALNADKRSHEITDVVWDWLLALHA